jgi:hypothetical protein
MMDPPFHSANNKSDDETVVTPTRGERTKPNDRESVEITLKFRFVPSRDNDNIHPAILHTHWMHEVATAFDKDNVRFFDNRNRQLSKIEPLRIDPEEYIKQFNLHFKRRIKSKTKSPSKPIKA